MGATTTLLYDTYLMLSKATMPAVTSSIGIIALKTSLARSRGGAVVGCFGMSDGRMRVLAVAGRSRESRLDTCMPLRRVKAEAMDYTCMGPARSNNVGMEATGLG